MTTMFNNTKVGLLAGLLTVVAVLAAGTIGATTSGTKGSIKVCKVIADINGNIVDGSAYPAASFSVTGFTPSPQTSEGAAAGALPNSVFSSPLSLNKHVVGSGTVYDAKCYTYSDLAIGNYYYSEESIIGSGWLDPLYNDQHTMSVSTLADFLPYSGQLFDSNSSNDGSRNTNSDGHIVLTSTVPNRTLVILNRRAADVCQTYETRSYGYWKNHSANWTLPQTIGTDVISTNSAVQSIFDNYSNSSLTKLKAQLLAMKFSMAYFGAGPAQVPGESITVNQLAVQADVLISSGTASDSQLDAMRVRVETVNLAHSISSCPTEPEVGYLKVIKEVVNDDGGILAVADFNLHVKFSGADVLGSPASGSTTGVLYVLEPGSYKVSEDSVAGYTGTVSGDCSTTGDVAVTANQTKICTIINNDNLPPGECKLEITKSVDKTSVVPGETVEFTLNFSNEGNANCTGGGVKVKDVIAQNLTYLSATNSGNVTPGYGTKPLYTPSTRTLIWNANTLTPGEAGWVKWQAEVKTPEICDNFKVTNTGHISSQEYSNFSTWVDSNEVEVNVTMSCIATLIVQKYVINDDAGTKQAADFTMNVTGGNASPNSFAGDEAGITVTLDAGSYSVDEGSHDGYTKTLGSDCSGTLASGETKICVITNDDIPPPPPEKSTLVVIKHVVNDNGGTKTSGDFTMNVTGTNVSASSFVGDEAGTAVTLDAGNYTVDEIDLTGYAKTISSDCNGSIAEGETKTCTITNNDLAATLTLIKTVLNDDGGQAQVSDFTPYIDGLAVTWGAANELSAGTFTASEDDLFGYLAGDWQGDCAVDGSITLELGDNKTCSIANDDIPAEIPDITLVVKKIVINDNGGSKVSADFTINVTGTNVSSSTFPGDEVGISVTLDAGSYSVDEGGHDGYTKTLGDDCAGTLASGETKTCVITNDDIPTENPVTTLIVKKHVINDNAGTKNAADFTLHVELADADITGSPAAGSETGVSYNINAGNYTVSEGTFSGYSLTSISGDCADDGQVTLAIGETKTCTLTNDDNPPQVTTGTLIVKKVVINNDGGNRPPSDFSLYVKLNGTNIPDSPKVGSETGTTYEVTPGTYNVSEAALPPSYSRVGITGDCDVNGNVAVGAGETKTCTITNDDQPGGGGGGGCSGNCGGGGGGGPVCTAQNSPNPGTVGLAIPAGGVVGSQATINLIYGLDIKNIILSNSPSFTPQSSIPLTNSTTWTLPAGGNVKTVYARFYNSINCSTLTQINITPTPQVLGASCINLSVEQELATTRDVALATSLGGRVVRQCSSNNAAWFVDPASNLRYYLPPNTEANDILRQFAVGITNANLNKIPVAIATVAAPDADSDGLSDALEQSFGSNFIVADTDGDGYADGEEVKNGYSPISTVALPIDLSFAAAQHGKVFLQTESVGEIWYVNPIDGKRYYIPNNNTAIDVLNEASACISDDEAHKLGIGLSVNGVALETVSTCYPPAPLVLGAADVLPRTGLPSDVVLALPLLIIMGYGVGKIGKDWIDIEV